MAKRIKFVFHLSLLLLTAVYCAVSADETFASMSFSETFLGGRTDSNRFDVWQDYTARFAFNLTTTGETATLYDAANILVPGSTQLPTHDESGFVLGAHSIDRATLNFTFSSSDSTAETIGIKAGIWDGNSTVWVGTYTLGNLITEILGVRKYADLSLNLVNLGYSQYLPDGRFVSFVIAPDLTGCTLNDFTVDRANLTMDVTPVPIPGASWLLGPGLAGLIGIRRRLGR
jgi:hypothetical protein